MYYKTNNIFLYVYLIPTLLISYPRVIEIKEIYGPSMSHMIYGGRRQWLVIHKEQHYKIRFT